MKFTHVISLVLAGPAILFASHLFIGFRGGTEFLETPKKGTFAIVLIVDKSDRSFNIQEFVRSISSYAVQTPELRVDKYYFLKSETSDQLFLRINKKSGENLDTLVIEKDIENIIKLDKMLGRVEYGILDDEGNLITTEAFKPNSLP
jgi:hypothetical protein